MATFGIEGNGRIEKTAIYYNGEQIGGLKELFIHIDEDGTFDSIIQYEGTDNKVYTKNIFEDHLENIKSVDPSFTEEEASMLHLFEIESDGDLENTFVYEAGEDEPLEGIVSVFIHIKGKDNKSGLKKLFNKDNIPNQAQFKATITFREEDDSITTEDIF